MRNSISLKNISKIAGLFFILFVVISLFYYLDSTKQEIKNSFKLHQILDRVNSLNQETSYMFNGLNKLNFDFINSLEKEKNSLINEILLSLTDEKYIDMRNNSTNIIFHTLKQKNRLIQDYKSASAILHNSHRVIIKYIPIIMSNIVKKDRKMIFENIIQPLLFQKNIGVEVVNKLSTSGFLSKDRKEMKGLLLRHVYIYHQHYLILKGIASANKNLNINNKILDLIENCETYNTNRLEFITKEIILFVIIIIILLINIIILNRKLTKKTFKTKMQKTELKNLLINFDKNVIASKTDLKGNITYVSQAFEKISGYKKHDIVSKPHRIVRHKDMPNSAFKEMWRTIKEQRIWKGEVKNSRKDGTFYWVSSIVSPEYDIDGNHIGYSSIRSDITAQKSVEVLKEKVLSQSADLKKQLISLRISETKLSLLIKQVQESHQHTKDSIKYASLIQNAIIPQNLILGKYFDDCFILWEPKDVVGGDIYLIQEVNEFETIVMVIDCTGHGVPGAFVTMLVKAVEKQIKTEIDNETLEKSPAKILQYFNREIKNLLNQNSVDSESNAGFDGGIIYFNRKTEILKFAGAETPLFYLDMDKNLHTIKGSRHSVGYKKSDKDFEFKEHSIQIIGEMDFYLTTDGYLDQNGGDKSFPFGKKAFKKIIENNKNQPLSIQRKQILKELNLYQRNEDRNDDITVIGLRIESQAKKIENFLHD